MTVACHPVRAEWRLVYSSRGKYLDGGDTYYRFDDCRKCLQYSGICIRSLRIYPAKEKVSRLPLTDGSPMRENYFTILKVISYCGNRLVSTLLLYVLGKEMSTDREGKSRRLCAAIFYNVTHSTPSSARCIRPSISSTASACSTL